MSSSSELLAEQTTSGDDESARGLSRATAPSAWEQSFDLRPGRSTPVRDRGARHLQFSLASMLQPTVRDSLATADRPLGALVLGCEEGYLAQQLLGWGVARVLAIEARPGVLQRALEVRELSAIDPEALELRAATASADLGLGGERFDIAVADGRPGRLGEGPGALELLAGCVSVCALITPDPLSGATALRAAGFGRPTLVEPPADAERRLIAFELNLMIARPEPAPQGEERS